MKIPDLTVYKTYIIALLILIFCPLLAVAEKFKIGIVLPLTGPLSFQGAPMKNSALLAKEHFDTEDRLELIFEDDSFLPRNTLTAVTKLVASDKIDALLVFGTNQGLAVVDYTESRKIPFISVNVNKGVVRNKKYSVILMPPLEDLTSLNIKHAKRLGYKKLALVATVQDSCLLQKKLVRESGEFAIVSDDEIIPTEISLREVATKIAKKKPDAVFLSTLAPQGSLVSKLLRENGYKGDFFGGQQLGNLDELKASQGALKDAWMTNGDDRKSNEYYKQYKEKFQALPTSESVYVYDAIKMFIEGFKSGDLNYYLHNINNFHAAGGNYSAREDNSFNVPVIVKKFNENGFSYVAD